MKILVGCEESGIVTEQLRLLGYNAFSCDIKPTSGKFPQFHYIDNVFNVINSQSWDIGIFFPPCTDLALSGAAQFKVKKQNGKQRAAIDFFLKIANCNIPKICIENPIGIMNEYYKPPTQIIQPFQFGDKAQKSTCLWLKNLNPLESTNRIRLTEFKTLIHKNGKTKKYCPWQYEVSKKTKTVRAEIRSKTFLGIAKAMAQQFPQPLKQLQLDF